MRIMFFDIETGSLDPKNGSLLSIGALAGDLDSGEIFQMEEWFHKLSCEADYKIEFGAFAVHNITAKECMEKGIPTEEIASNLIDVFVNNQCILLGGHNIATYDIPWLCHHLYKTNIAGFTSNFTYRIIDSHSVIRLFAGTENMKSGASLKQTATALGIDTKDLTGKYHGALFDAIVSFRILYKFRKVLTQPEVVELLTK